MSLNISKIKAVVFDYGNTMIKFDSENVVRINQDLLAVMTGFFGACDENKFCEIRKRQIITPYATEEYKENDRKGICVELVKELYGVTPDDSQILMMMDTKHKSFVDSVKCPDFVKPILGELKKHFQLAFISNYPCTESIHDSLRKLELYDYFESIVISGEMGIIKPHNDIFRKCLEELKLKAEDCVYIGDNWLADIQGAKRIGMQAVHTTQYVSYEKFEPYEGDFQPDAVINHLDELTGILF